MNIFFKIRDDFHWFAGRKLGLSNEEITNNLNTLVGNRTDLYGHYSVLKDDADKDEKRAFLIHLIKYYLSDFMGTEYCLVQEEQIEEKSKEIELDILEKYAANMVKPDGDWNEWRKMIVNFDLSTPSEFVNLTAELKRLGLPSFYERSINKSGLKFYSADRRLRNLAFTSLNSASNEEEFITAELIHRRFLDVYYRQQGINAKIEHFKGSLFGCTSDDSKNYLQIRGGEQIPFLPLLPPGIMYDAKFYEHVRNIVRGEHNLFKFEWRLAQTIRFGHHDIIVCALDKTSNDCLEQANSYSDLEKLTKQNDVTQNQAITLLKGDYAQCLFTRFLNDSGVKEDEKQNFLRAWLDHDVVFVTSAIEGAYDEGEKLDPPQRRSVIVQKKMIKALWFRLHKRPQVCKHFKENSPFPCTSW